MGTKYYFRTAIQEKNAAFFQVLKNDKKPLKNQGFGMARSGRFERPTHSLEGCCSIQLS